ncbi:hypothetical protein [Euryhalocaulis caribicus]|uniref:hypothetical protein n=1 Tax=Euryhalocaulis caribicus TaxID=1161401 RepID=UPI0003A22FAA|nr:hypothetical protein [Euryhalocaulis caribicus]
MADSLAGFLPKDRFKQLLRVPADDGADATLRAVADGEGTETPLHLSASEATFGESGAPIDKVLDEDDFASDDAKALVTQQSVKAYIDKWDGPTINAARYGYGEAGNSDSDNAAALELATDAVRAALPAGNMIYPAVKFVMPPGLQPLGANAGWNTGLDLGGIRAGVILDARGAVLQPSSALAGKSVVDMLGSRWIMGSPPSVWSPDPLTMPACGYLFGRDDDLQAAGEHEFLHASIKGFFSLAGIFNNASELLGWPNAVAWNAYPDADIGAEDTFANRDTHDGEAAGYVFLCSDGAGGLGGDPVLYRKASATSGDWEGPIAFHGESGDAKVRSWAYVADAYNHFDVSGLTNQTTSLTRHSSQPSNAAEMPGVNVRKIDYDDGWQGSGKGAAMLLINTKGHKYRGYATSFDTCGVEIWPVDTEYCLDLSYLHCETDGQVSSIRISNKFTDNPTLFDFRHTDASTSTSGSIIDIDDLTTLTLQASEARIGNPDNPLFSDFSKLRGSGNRFFLPDGTHWSDPHADFECWFYPGDGDPKHYGALDIPEFNDAPTSFTPTVEFNNNGDFVPTYNTQIGYYKQVGNIVYFNINLDFDVNAYTTASGGLKIGGLPAWSASYGHQTAAVGWVSNIDAPGTAYSLFAVMFDNALDAMFIGNAKDALSYGLVGTSNVPASTTGVVVQVSGHYFVD